MLNRTIRNEMIKLLIDFVCCKLNQVEVVEIPVDIMNPGANFLFRLSRKSLGIPFNYVVT